MDTDYQKELEHPIDMQGADREEEALRYFALLILYTLTLKAPKLKIKRKKKALEITVGVSPEKKVLTPPPEGIVQKIFEIIRSIIHLDTDSGEVDFSFGLRSGQVDLQVIIKKEGETETMKLLFPKL
jgi:hypothetical protein